MAEMNLYAIIYLYCISGTKVQKELVNAIPIHIVKRKDAVLQVQAVVEPQYFKGIKALFSPRVGTIAAVPHRKGGYAGSVPDCNR